MAGPDNLSKSFGLMIAFVLPGVVGVYALSFFVPVVREWFGIAADRQTSLGGFLFVTVASIGMGVFLSGIRWLLIDGLMAKAPKNLDYGRRRDEKTEAAYQDIIFRHYQFYQFYSNMIVALAVLFLAWLTATEPQASRAIWLAVLMLIADVIMFLSARDALRKYDDKIRLLLTHSTRTVA